MEKYYEYAYFIVSEYVCKKSYNIAMFYDYLGIDEEIFTFCLEVIKNFNIDLYNKYLEKKEQNKIIRFENILFTFKDLANGIEHGYLKNNEEFNILEFLKRVPFKYNNKVKEQFSEFRTIGLNIKGSYQFNKRINNFLKATLEDKRGIILKYLKDNNISDNSIKPIDLKELYNTNSNLITKEENENIINYIKVKKLPMIKKVYAIIKGKYLNNEIDLNIQKYEEEKKYTLIP